MARMYKIGGNNVNIVIPEKMLKSKINPINSNEIPTNVVNACFLTLPVALFAIKRYRTIMAMPRTGMTIS